MATENPAAVKAYEKLASVKDSVRRGTTNPFDEPVTVVEAELRRRRRWTLYPLVGIVVLLLLVGLFTVVIGASRLLARADLPPVSSAAAVARPATPQA